MARKQIKRGARQRDVASAAGVSTATVSAVVNGRAEQYGICRATQEKVQAVIRQMAYAPSLAALDMVAGRNSLVGIALSANCPGADRLIAALEPALAQAGLRLLVISLPTDPAMAAVRITDLARFGVGGLAIYPARTLSLPMLGCPVVMVGKAGVGLPIDCDQTAVNQLGQAAAWWLRQASQGTPPPELLLVPDTGVVAAPIPPVPVPVPASPIPMPVPRSAVIPGAAPNPPAVSLSNPPVVSLPNPPAVSLSNPPAVSLPNPTPAPVTVPHVMPPTPVTPPVQSIPIPMPTPDPEVIEPAVASPAETGAPVEEASESIQIPETVIPDAAGQAVSDPQTAASAEVDGREEEESELVTPPVESVPIPMPTPDPEVIEPEAPPPVAQPVVVEPVVVPVPEPTPVPVPLEAPIGSTGEPQAEEPETPVP